MEAIYATEENFDTLVSEGIVLVDFTATWCGPCKMLARELEELEDEMPFIKIVKVDVDKCPNIARKFHVDGIPDLYYYKDGQAVTHSAGAVTCDDIKERLAKLLY